MTDVKRHLDSLSDIAGWLKAVGYPGSAQPICEAAAAFGELADELAKKPALYVAVCAYCFERVEVLRKPPTHCPYCGKPLPPTREGSDR